MDQNTPTLSWLDLPEDALELHEILLIFASLNVYLNFRVLIHYFRRALVERTGGLLPAGFPAVRLGLLGFPLLATLRLALLLA